jgi:hypothetical protein
VRGYAFCGPGYTSSYEPVVLSTIECPGATQQSFIHFVSPPKTVPPVGWLYNLLLFEVCVFERFANQGGDGNHRVPADFLQTLPQLGVHVDGGLLHLVKLSFTRRGRNNLPAVNGFRAAAVRLQVLQKAILLELAAVFAQLISPTNPTTEPQFAESTIRAACEKFSILVLKVCSVRLPNSSRVLFPQLKLFRSRCWA